METVKAIPLGLAIPFSVVEHIDMQACGENPAFAPPCLHRHFFGTLLGAYARGLEAMRRRLGNRRATFAGRNNVYVDSSDVEGLHEIEAIKSEGPILRYLETKDWALSAPSSLTIPATPHSRPSGAGSAGSGWRGLRIWPQCRERRGHLSGPGLSRPPSVTIRRAAP